MRVSIIIPCFNVADYVERAISSAMEQTHQGIEVICVDDGSTDDTRDILARAEARYQDRLQVIHQANKGACAARNAGAERAGGTYLQFLDADDVLLPSKIQHQVQLAKEHGLPDLIIGSSRTVSVNGDTLKTTIQPGDRSDHWLALLKSEMNVTSAILWKKEAVSKAGGWDGSLGSSQEYDLMFRMLQNGSTVVHDPEVLTEIHERTHGRISQTNLDRNWTRLVELQIRIIDQLAKVAPTMDLTDHYQALFDGIRTLYIHDKERAIAFYRKYIPASFKPKASKATGRSYILTHQLFGFEIANRIGHMVRSRSIG